jgi:flavin-dependent dehydrogenase
MARDQCKVLIVGGGPAGISTALFLAWARPELGEQIVVLEKANYPRDKFCAGGLGGRADRLLSSIGVKIDTPSVPIHGVSLQLADGGICARGGNIGRVVRRMEFDHALVEVARKRGIRVVEGACAERLTWLQNGVEIETPKGAHRAEVLVGADGVGSFVRRALRLVRGGLTAQVIELDTEPVASDPHRDLLHFDASDSRLSGYAWDFPTLVNGIPLVCRGVYHLKLGDTAPDIRAILARRLDGLGLDINRYRVKRFAERGFAPPSNDSF